MRVKHLVRSSLYTPVHRYSVIGWTLLTLVAGPIAVTNYFSVTLERGYYPQEADSIIIPILAYCVGWLVTAPLVMLLAVLVTRRYPGEIPIGVWSKSRPWSAALYSLPAAIWILYKLICAVTMAYDLLLLNAVYDLCWILPALWFRACAVAALNARKV